MPFSTPFAWGAIFTASQDFLFSFFLICPYLQSEQRWPFTLGQYLWTGWDYIGEPTPYHTRSSYFGTIDTAGFPKDAYYVVQAAWLDPKTHPMVHLFPYWDFNEGQLIDLCACTNAHSVELFVNGKSLGRKVLDSAKGRTASWQTAYHPGSVKVVAYDENGKVVATDEQDSFDDSAMVCLQADRKTISGDGRELAFITITTRDKNGNPVRNANDRVTVRVNGAGVLVGLDNGDSADPDEYQTDSRRLFSGMLLAAARAGKARRNSASRCGGQWPHRHDYRGCHGPRPAPCSADAERRPV